MTVVAREVVSACQPVVTVSLLSTGTRRRTLIPRLEVAGIECHVLLFQSEREDVTPPSGSPVLPPLHGPLLIDTGGLTPMMQVRVLDELVRCFPTGPTMLLAQPADGLIHRLAPSCPAMFAGGRPWCSGCCWRRWHRHLSRMADVMGGWQPQIIGRSRVLALCKLTKLNGTRASLRAIPSSPVK